MNENGKRSSINLSGSAGDVGATKRFRADSNDEDKAALVRRVEALERTCAALQQEVFYLRQQLNALRPDHLTNNHNHLHSQRNTPSSSRQVIHVLDDSSSPNLLSKPTSGLSSSREKSSASQPVDVSTPSPPVEVLPARPLPPTRASLTSPSHAIPLAHSSSPSHTYNHTAPHTIPPLATTPSLLSTTAATTSSAITTHLPTVTSRYMPPCTSYIGPSSPASPSIVPLSTIKIEFPPFKPDLPYRVDEELTIERETEPKKVRTGHTPKRGAAHGDDGGSPMAIDIPEDVQILGARPAANLPHSRYHCPNIKFTCPTYQDHLDKPLNRNASFCDDCYCYVCDKKCSECPYWSVPEDGAAHCNAYASSIWKPLRAVHKNELFMHLHKHYLDQAAARRAAASGGENLDSDYGLQRSLVSDVTQALALAALEPRASELGSAFEYYHDTARRTRVCTCEQRRNNSNYSDSDGSDNESGGTCWHCDMVNSMNRLPQWVTVNNILERLTEDIKYSLCADDLTTLVSGSAHGTYVRRLAQAFVVLDITTEKLSQNTWRRAEADAVAEGMYKTVVKRLCYYWLELSLDHDVAPEIRKTAVSRLKSLTDAAVEQVFKDIMRAAIDIGGSGWDYPELQKIQQGKMPAFSTNVDENALLTVCMRLLFRSKQWEQLVPFVKYASSKGVIVASHPIFPIAMVRMGQFHEAVNWCFLHVNSLRFHFYLELGSVITEMPDHDELVADASFRLGILALHKAVRRDYAAPSIRVDLALWLVRTLSGRGLGPTLLAERNTPGMPSARLQSVRQLATRIFTLDEQRLHPILRGTEGYSRKDLATALGVERDLVPHLELELALLLCVGVLEASDLARIPDVLKANNDLFGILSLASHMPQDTETIMNIVVSNVLPKLGVSAATGLVEKWLASPSISDFLLVQFVSLFIKEGNKERAFGIGERIVTQHKNKSTSSRFSTYCAMTKLAELLWPLAIEAGKLDLAKVLAQATFDETPSWKNLELLQKSHSGEDWPATRDHILSLIRASHPPYVAIPSIRRLELLARSARFADAAAVLKETSLSSPEEATIIRDVFKDLRSNNPDKMEEFAKSVLPWLETMTFRGFADEIWSLLIPALPQFALSAISKFQEQLEEQFDRKTVQEGDRRLMVHILLLLRKVYMEMNNEPAWNNRMRKLVQGNLRRKSALMSTIKMCSILFERFPPPGSAAATMSAGLLPSAAGLGTNGAGFGGSGAGLSGSHPGLTSSFSPHASINGAALRAASAGLNASAGSVPTGGAGIAVSTGSLVSSFNGLTTSSLNSSSAGLNTSATGIQVSSAGLAGSGAAVNISGAGLNAATSAAFSSSAIGSSSSNSSTSITSMTTTPSRLPSTFPHLGPRLTPVSVAATSQSTSGLSSINSVRLTPAPVPPNPSIPPSHQQPGALSSGAAFLSQSQPTLSSSSAPSQPLPQLQQQQPASSQAHSHSHLSQLQSQMAQLQAQLAQQPQQSALHPNHPPVQLRTQPAVPPVQSLPHPSRSLPNVPPPPPPHSSSAAVAATRSAPRSPDKLAADVDLFNHFVTQLPSNTTATPPKTTTATTSPTIAATSSPSRTQSAFSPASSCGSLPKTTPQLMHANNHHHAVSLEHNAPPDTHNGKLVSTPPLAFQFTQQQQHHPPPP